MIDASRASTRHRIHPFTDGNVYLKELAALGVLGERKVGREKLFVHPRLLELLTTDAGVVAPYS